MKSIIALVFALLVIRVRATARYDGLYLYPIANDSSSFIDPSGPYPRAVPVSFNVVDNLLYIPDVDRLVYGYDIIREAGLTPIPTEFIFCQAFKDKGGKGPIGKPFTKAPLGSQRFSTTRIYVGSVFCSDAAAVRAYVQSRPADGIPVVQFKPRPFVGLFFGGLTLNVFLDNSITLLTLANDVYSVGIFYTPITVTVSCQLYGDKQAKQKIGGPFFSHNVQEDATNLTEDPDFVATRVRAIRCRAVP